MGRIAGQPNKINKKVKEPLQDITEKNYGTIKLKYVLGNGSFFKVKCHHSFS